MDRKIISKIVKASGISSGEMILIHFWGEDADKEIANNVMVAVAEIGATPVLLQQSRTVNRDIFLAAKESCYKEQYFDLFAKFDAVLDVFAYRPVVLGYDIKNDKFELYRKYMAQLFSKLMNCKRFTQIRIPTAANAEESGLEPRDYIYRMERAYDIDYAAVYNACKQAKDRFKGVGKVLLRTGEDCELSFELTDRTWHIDAGEGDLPCGEIYIAPVEDKTQGTVYFEVFYLDGVKYDHVLLYIKEGKISGGNQPEITAFFEKQPQENRVVCELGFGMNPNVTDLCGYAVLDEKMCGTFHIAVGANNMFGGTNAASDHIDFVGRGMIVESLESDDMNEQQHKFELYLDERIAACKKSSELLAANDRLDEGNFEKVRANVYEIFKTILSVADKVCGKDDLAKKRFFLQKAEQIPTNWVTSYEKANQHGDVEKMHMESVKLDVIHEIKDMYMQIWEETT